MICRFCGQDDGGLPLLHRTNCDGRQGRRDALEPVPPPLPVLDPDETTRVTEKAIGQVRHARDADLRPLLDSAHAMLDSRQRGERITVDDIWNWVGRPVMASITQRSVAGPLMRTLRAAGRIEPTGEWQRSDRPETHGVPHRVWCVR